MNLFYVLHNWRFVKLGVGGLFAFAALIIADTSPVTPYLLGILVTVGLAILGLLWRIQGRMSVVETQVTPLWAALQREVAATLHNPELKDKEADALIEDLEYKMTPAKTARLRVLMLERAHDMTRNSQERKRAELLLFIMGQIFKEKKEGC